LPKEKGKATIYKTLNRAQELAVPAPHVTPVMLLLNTNII
jgi:hypothetical protein